MKTRNISIVDDDKIYHYTAKKIIGSLGLNINLLPFYDGEEALNHIKLNLNNPFELPDTLFLDINMPNMDGWDFLNEFSQLSLALPKPIIIYMVSSSVSEADLSKAKTYKSVSGYIVKPVKKDVFFNVISELFEYDLQT